MTRLAAVRDAGYTAFAPLFVVVRLLAFSWITFGCLLPDTLAVLPTAAAAGKRTALRMLCGFGVAFNALMLYWFGGAVVGLLNQPVVEAALRSSLGLADVAVVRSVRCDATVAVVAATEESFTMIVAGRRVSRHRRNKG